MIIIENNEPNFIVKKEFTLEFDNKKLFKFEEDDFLEIKKVDNGLSISNKFLISKFQFEKIKNNISEIGEVQLEETLSDNLEECGLVIKPYLKESNKEELIISESNNINNDLIVVEQIFNEFVN